MNKEKKIVILGSGGMAGHVLTLMMRSEPRTYDVIDVARTDNGIKPRVLLDVSNFSALEDLIRKETPDVVVNCVGLLNEAAEGRPDKAILINSYLPHFLETITRNTATKVIHISTDCVFSGSKGGYLETDDKDGKGFYAQSKALGEIDNKKDLTIRTSIIGPELKANGAIGLFHWFAFRKEPIRGFTKAFWTGVTTIELARAIQASIKQDVTGIYHLVYKEKISKFDLLIILKNEFGLGIPIDSYDGYVVDKSLINNRTDFKYKVPPYADMIREMRTWIESHPAIYHNYQHLFV